ncbi:MAG: VWA containing CoxE family protein [Lachnospiraceae bacterium]|nr:VWA containing CoxE family protein [Lachnospiraceae bacterium]
MFTSFFYLLRARGFDVSMTEWITLMEGLDKGLAHASLTDFFHLARAVLVKSETDYAKFDRVFLEYFREIAANPSEIPDEFMSWLENDEDLDEDLRIALEHDILFTPERERQDREKIIQDMMERLREQKERHDGGSKFIGTKGRTAFGNAGKNAGGVRINGHIGRRSAFEVISDEKYEDFRTDKALQTRQFEMAFRRLRSLSANLDVEKTELDIDGTVDSTCNNGGMLKLEFQKPRKNQLKLLVMIDSGGSMTPYRSLCANLFQALNRANHFKDLKFYYFHNCVYEKVYNTPECDWHDVTRTDWIMHNYGRDYRLILVGDARMSMDELVRFEEFHHVQDKANTLTGIEMLRILRKHYDHSVWFNPRRNSMMVQRIGARNSEAVIAEVFPMYYLSVQGLADGIRQLLVNR